MNGIWRDGRFILATTLEDQIVELEGEIARLKRRNDELTASEEDMACQLRVAKAGEKLAWHEQEKMSLELRRLKGDT